MGMHLRLQLGKRSRRFAEWQKNLEIPVRKKYNPGLTRFDMEMASSDEGSC